MTRTCTCSIHSPFRFRDFPRASTFASDGAFTPRNTKGQTISQIASDASARYTKITGRSLGSISGISAAGNLGVEEGNARRAKR